VTAPRSAGRAARAACALAGAPDEKARDAPERAPERHGPDLRLRRPVAVLAVVYGASAIVLAAALTASAASGLPGGYFSRRPMAGTPCVDVSCFFAGLVTRVALMAWVACAAGCLLLAYLARRSGERPRRRGMLVYAGAFTAALALDEAFLLHDAVGALVPGGKLLFYFGYAAAASGFVVAYRSAIRRTSWWILALALGLLAASIGLDQLTSREFLEDASKLLGVAAWTTYFLGTGVAMLRPRLAAPAGKRPVN
jgi:hypothetical protein